VNTLLRQEVNLELCTTELLIGKVPDPSRHLGLQLDRTPSHAPTMTYHGWYVDSLALLEIWDAPRVAGP